MYGLAFHPDFEKNRQCFVCYTLRGRNRGQPNLPDGTRVSRFTVTQTDPPRIDPASEEIVLTFLQGGHNGGDLHFGPDGMLYISTGDAANPNPPDPLNTGQDISDLLSSILRIDVDRKDDGQELRRPEGQPVRRDEGRPAGGLGLRLPQPLADELRPPDRRAVRRRRRLGTVGDGPPGREGRQLRLVGDGGAAADQAGAGRADADPPAADRAAAHDRLQRHRRAASTAARSSPSCAAPTSSATGRRAACGPPASRATAPRRCRRSRGRRCASSPSARTGTASCTSSTTTAARSTPSSGTTAAAEERRLPDEAVADRAVRLGQGPHAGGRGGPVRGEQPAVAGRGRRRSTGSPSRARRPPPCTPTGKPIPGMVYWHNFRMHFPKDAVLVRTLSLGGRRLETQILHFDGVDWRAYTFAWRDDQTDADLVPADGAEKEVRDGRSDEEARLAVPQPQPVHVVPQQPVGIRAGVPARAIEPAGARRPQPARRLTEAGFIRRAGNDGKPLPPFDAASAAREPKLADPADAGQPLEARARAYLHANCGHCHSDHGGGSVPLRLQFPIPVAEMKAVGVRPTARRLRPRTRASSSRATRTRAPCTSAWPSSAATDVRHPVAAELGHAEVQRARPRVARLDDARRPAARSRRAVGRTPTAFISATGVGNCSRRGTDPPPWSEWQWPQLACR